MNQINLSKKTLKYLKPDVIIRMYIYFYTNQMVIL